MTQTECAFPRCTKPAAFVVEMPYGKDAICKSHTGLSKALDISDGITRVYTEMEK